MKIVTAAQMRAMDQTVINDYGMPGMVLMENAALTVVDVIAARYAPLDGKRIAVVCGKGNNGGDGLAVARHLFARFHAQVTIWLAEPMDRVTPETKLNLDLARKYGVLVKPVGTPEELTADLVHSYLIVDAVLGTGIEGDPKPQSALAIKAINDSGQPVVSIDVPSGLNVENGECGNPTVAAGCTVTLALSKLGLHLYPGIKNAGELMIADIGFPAEVQQAKSIHTIVPGNADITAWLPRRVALRDSNKGTFGSVALFVGSPGFAGAATLASLGAARTGAGLVTVGVPEPLLDTMMVRAPESVMCRPFPATPKGSFDASGADLALKFVETRKTVGIGCGIGHEEEGVCSFLKRLAAECNKPMVIDADALTILSKESDQGASLLQARTAATLLTPHPGEMARLLATDTKSIQADRLGAVRDAAKKFNAVVVLKGMGTLVAAPDGRLAINPTGNPGMGTGGTGDVLTGVSASMLGQIDDPWQAAVAAVYLHGRAGDLVAGEIGLAGLLAADLANRLPQAIRSCYPAE